jgi:hypothetical protein
VLDHCLGEDVDDIVAADPSSDVLVVNLLEKCSMLLWQGYPVTMLA